MEAIIFVGIQGSGKTTFYRERFLDRHVRISLDLLKTRNRESAALKTCLETGQPFVIDNTNPRAADRAVIPVPGVIATFKRLELPSIAEGFDELHVVTHGENSRFVVDAPSQEAGDSQLKPAPRPQGAMSETRTRKPPGIRVVTEVRSEVKVESKTAIRQERKIKVRSPRYRIFLLSPANVSGERGRLLLRTDARFDLAARLRLGTATLGEAFAFISGLYFRGKLAYAETFAAPPPGIPGAFVITGGQGLIPPETPVTLRQLQELASVPIDSNNPRYRLPFERHCRILGDIAGVHCEFVLLGSLATPKYLEPASGIFGERLLFPEKFVGRGDLSRGGLMLRSAREGVELKYLAAVDAKSRATLTGR
jgi:hypothetical protein